MILDGSKTYLKNDEKNQAQEVFMILSNPRKNKTRPTLCYWIVPSKTT